MDMCYDGALIMPSNYAMMDEEEMIYVEGGAKLTVGLTIKSNSFIISLLSSIGGALTMAKATAALNAATGAIITAIELGTAGAATLYAGALILAAGAIIPTIASTAVSYGISRLKGKSFTKTVNTKLLKKNKKFVAKI